MGTKVCDRDHFCSRLGLGMQCPMSSILLTLFPWPAVVIMEQLTSSLGPAHPIIICILSTVYDSTLCGSFISKEEWPDFFFLTTVLEHVVADGCTANVYRVFLKNNLTQNKEANKLNQTLQFIFEKRKKSSWGCFQALHYFKRKAELFFFWKNKNRNK